MKLRHKEALNILGLERNSDLEGIKNAYRKACSKYHPDRNPAGLEMMKLVNAAYAVLTDGSYNPDNTDFDEECTQGLGDELNAALNAIINFGLTIEICGSWIWVSGDTRPHKDMLKDAGYKWAPVKKMWHFRPSDSKSWSRGKFSMDQIRAKHGSTEVKSKSYARLGA